MAFPGSRAPARDGGTAGQRSLVSSAAQLLLVSCIVVICWEVLIRLTTTITRTPAQVSLQWTACEETQQHSNTVPEYGVQIPEVPPLSQQEAPVENEPEIEKVVPEVAQVPDVKQLPSVEQAAANITFVGQPLKSVAEKRACIRNTFASGTSPHERRTYSQVNEDGIISALFQCLTAETKFYVEFGVENGMECSTRNLRENEGWTGLLMDGGNENPLINLHQEFFTAENIVGLFAQYSVPRHFDHLTVDIDQNTFWVLHSVLLAGYRPRSLVVEINRNFHPLDSFVVPYNSTRMWDSTNAFGASVGAYAKLLSDFGYQIIAVDQDQINLYAVDSAEIGAEPVLTMAEVVTGVRGVDLCSSLHTCTGLPTLYLQVPDDVSLARPRQEWYTSLPVWSLACSSWDGLKVMFTGVQMEAPANATEASVGALEPAPLQPLAQPHSNLSSPCGTVEQMNSFGRPVSTPSTPRTAPTPAPIDSAVVAAPGAAPVAASTVAPVQAPVAAISAAPVAAPIAASIVATGAAPIAASGAAPVTVSGAAPVEDPVAVPVTQSEPAILVSVPAPPVSQESTPGS